MSSALDIAEVYCGELGKHPAKHGLDLWLSKGFSFKRRPTGAMGNPKLSRPNAPTRERSYPGPRRTLKRQINSSPQLLVNNLTGVRIIIADMRRRGASPQEVQRYVVTQTTFTLRKVFAACSDAFELSCYAATSTT